MIWLILATALALRLVLINQSLWLDEAIEVLAVKDTSYFKLITSYSLGDFHPPLYHLVLKFWTGLFGYSEIIARLPSVIFAIVTVYFTYKIAKQLFTKQTAFLVALFIALSPLHVYYSQEARMYSLATLLVTMTVYFFLRLLKNSSLVNNFFFVLTTVLFLYTDYLPYLMLLVFNLYVFLQRKNLGKKWLVNWLMLQILIVILLLPWLPFLIKQLVVGHNVAAAVPIWKETVGGFSFKALPLTLAKFIIGRISFENKILYGFIFFILSSLFAGLIIKGLTNLNRQKSFILLWLIVPILGGWLISFFVPVYSYFRFLFVIPAFYLLLALGIEKINVKTTKILFVTSVVLVEALSLFIFWTNPRFQKEDWKSAVSWIERNAPSANATAVFVTGGQIAPFKYYANEISFSGPTDWQSKSYQELFLIRYVQPIFDPDDNLRQEVERNSFAKIEEKDFNGVTVWHYVYR